MIRILAISGSLRQQSFNTALLRAMEGMAPAEWSISLRIPRGFPIYDEDLQKQGWPAPVTGLEQDIRDADCVVIATPEYNYSIPGGLKNAIDWVSRVPDQPFKGKLVGIMGASGGRLGAVRAQLHLRQCFQFLDARVINRPEVLVGNAAQMFQDGVLADPASREALGAFISVVQRELDPSRQRPRQGTA